MEIGGGSAGLSLETHNLRDLLRIKEDDHVSNRNRSTTSHGGGDASSGLTLLALFTDKIAPPSSADAPLRSVNSSSRTLYDIIREERMSSNSGVQSDGGNSWRQLTEKIRRYQGGRNLSQDLDEPVNNHHHNRTTFTRPPSDRFDSVRNSTASTHISNSNPSQETEAASGSTLSSPRNRWTIEGNRERGEAPARRSLMTLLTENERQMGLNGSAYVEEAATEELNRCCVCMVGQKGAAFIPCGHTFCRECSRELWVQRGNCPVCNKVIIEILDIF